MSTQSPMPPTPKGPRNNRQNQKRNTTPHTQKASLLTTPPSSPPRNLSPNGTTTDSSNNINLSKKKVGRSGKKPREASKPSPAYNNGHRYTSSQRSITSPQMKDSPHYAGPTFHASPAPSALPMPSFFSKSVPESDLAPALELDSDGLEIDPELESTPSKPKSRPQYNVESKPTPLDFLFKAAVEARNPKPQDSPEVETRTRFPTHNDVRAPPSQRKPDSVVGGMFPLEMENTEPRKPSIGPAFATPYRDRMNALRSASSPSQPAVDLDEDQRRAKTEALKHLLLNPRPQRPPSASPFISGPVNGLRDYAGASPSVPRSATPLRTASGPATPVSHGSLHGKHEPVFGNGMQSQFSPSQPRQNQQSYINGPNPRQEMPSPNPKAFPGGLLSSPHASYHHHSPVNRCAVQPSYASPMPQHSPSSRAMPANIPSSSKALDTKKMEDDLRRILKLDVTPGVQAHSVQSSFA